MKTFTLIIVILSCITLNSLAQIQAESLNLKVPIISSKNTTLVSRTGPIFIVKIDSFEYKLDSISSNHLDADWIQSIIVLKDNEVKEKYGCEGEHGLVIIRLKKYHIEDFLEGEKADTPLKIKTLN